jgi:exonuclease SbcC
MRILAIRGCNLNSLADAFEIDFTSEPLRSAGLFAITGDTGAGKSTILDALCLALYGECPRLKSGEGKEAVIDAGGEIQANDARSCLRKGAASGHAEVDYMGNDGVAYRVKWAVRRARNKADGKLQQAERTLTNIATGTIEAASETLVRERVPLTTGLTYDEFRRTVLLAQGEFDALLRASPSMRAELLEKITGTEIYRDISRRAFERCQTEEAAVKTLQDRRGEHKVMSADERAAMHEECVALDAQDIAAAAQIAELEQMIARHRALQEASDALAIAQQRLTDATAAVHAAGEDRTRLHLLDRAEPLRALLSRAQECRDASQGAGTELTLALQRRALDEEADRNAAEHVQAATSALAALDQQVEMFTPEWDRALALDSAVAAAQAELLKVEAMALDAQALRETAATALEGAMRAFAHATETLALASARATKLEPTRPLGERWPEIEGKLEKQRDFRRDLSAAQINIMTLTQDIATLDARLQTIGELDEGDRRSRDACDAQLIELRAAHLAMNEAALETRGVSIGQLAEDVRALARASVDWRQAEQERLGAQSLQHAAGQALAEAADVAEQARQAGAIARGVLDGLSDPLEQAQLAMSDEAERLRLRLRPGEPCAVCGSREHPIHGDAALAALAASLQAKVENARTTISSADHKLLAAQGQIAAQGERLKEAARAQERARMKLDGAERDYAKSLEPARAAWSAEDLAGSLPDAAATFEDSCVALVESAREDCASRLKQARELRSQIESVVKTRDQLVTALETRSIESKADNIKLTADRAAVMLAEQTATMLADRILSSNRELEVWLTPAGIGAAELDRDLDSCLARLLQASNAWREAVSAHEAALAEMRACEPLKAEAQGKLVHAEDVLAKARQAVAERKLTLSEQQAERAALLGGEATNVHKGRILAARIAANTLQSEAIGKASSAAAALATSAASVRSAERRQREAIAAMDAAEAALNEAIKTAGIARDQAAHLLATSPEDVKILRDRLQQIDRAVIVAESALAERSNDLEAALTAGVPELSREELTAQCEALNAQQRERQGRFIALRSLLQQDDVRLAQVADLDKEIAGASAIATLWKQISEAIGSRDGAKFTRFAQSITLDLLLELANRRLADLNPRYALVKAGELGFQVIDNEFGEELRSTRSLSGGERFLVSLAMALALSGLGGRQTFADTLFIDEGFGSLDSDTLDVAIDALETLQSQGRNVGVISHVEAMKERIPIQIRVVKQGGGKSAVSIVGHETMAYDRMRPSQGLF